MLVAALTLVIALVFAPGIEDAPAPTAVPTLVDSDGDGLLDHTESGMRLASGIMVSSDPDSRDTDGDGLPDKDEVGSVRTESQAYGAVYEGVSHPRRSDTDFDGLDDATELDGGFDPWASDSDADGLSDFAEIEFGSNPLTADSDGDGLKDVEEFEAGGDPNLADLSATQEAEALMAGLGVPALDLTDEQTVSWPYCAGLLVRTILKSDRLGKLKSGGKIVTSLAKADWNAAIAHLQGLVPGVPELRDILDRLRAGDRVGALVALRALAPELAGATALFEAVNDLVRSTPALASAMARAVAMLPGPGDDVKVDVFRSIARLVSIHPLAVDAATSGGVAPDPLPLSRPISVEADLNEEKDALVRTLQSDGYVDIRINEAQVNALGQVVGSNRPDVQAIDANGVRHIFELGDDDSGWDRKLMRDLVNDIDAEVHRQ